MQKAEIIFTSYNDVIEKTFENAFQEFKGKELSNENEKKVLKCLDDNIRKWIHAPIEELDGLVPFDYFDAISDLDKILELFKLGCKICDEGLPYILPEKLKNNGQRAINSLLELAADKSLAANEEELPVVLMSIRLLGEWKTDEAVRPLINLVIENAVDNETVSEEVISALLSIGEPAIRPIIQFLEDEANAGEPAVPFLFSVLAGIGSEHKSDRIYRCLKNMFYKIDNKVLGAACLGDYGDGRAVTALRGYVEKNIGKLDRETFFEIKHTIEKLGGNMDDIKVRFV